jgi:hypothetical protein
MLSPVVPQFWQPGNSACVEAVTIDKGANRKETEW